MKKYYHMEIEELFANYDIVVKAVIQKIMRRKEGQNHDHPLDGWS